MSQLTAKERHSTAADVTQVEHVDFKPQLRPGELLTGTPTVTVVAGSGEVTVSNEQLNTSQLELRGVDAPRTALPGEVAQFQAAYAAAVTVAQFVFKVECDTIKAGVDPYRHLVGWIVVPVETAPTA